LFKGKSNYFLFQFEIFYLKIIRNPRLQEDIRTRATYLIKFKTVLPQLTPQKTTRFLTVLHLSPRFSRYILLIPKKTSGGKGEAPERVVEEWDKKSRKGLTLPGYIM